jgi:hypothetical protein
MSESQAPAAAESGADLNPENDPEIAELLKFEPVERRFKREDGWSPPLQRAFIAELAKHGSPGKACDALGKRRSGIDKLYKVAGAESFRAAWHRAVEIAEERAAAKIRADHAAIAGQKAPFRDHRRGSTFDPVPEPQPEISEDEQWSAIENLGVKFLMKVAAEREARLAGRIVEADFYLRQITFMEVMFDLTASRFGWEARDALRELRRGGHGLLDIVSTPLADWLDRSRRNYWETQGDPPRPEHPDRRFVVEHNSSPWGSRGPEGFSTQVDQHALGALTTPARGYTQEQWAAMGMEEQKRARQRQFDEDAAAQLEWEATARAEFEARGE